MPRTLAIAFVLAMLAGAVVASVATAAPPDRSSIVVIGQFRFAFALYL